MTNIDTKRLASDPGYWEKLGAPEWAQSAIKPSGDPVSGVFWFEHRVGVGVAESVLGGYTITANNIPPSGWKTIAVRPVNQSNAADQEKRILVETFVAGPGRDRIVMGDSERVMRHGDRVEIYLTRSRESEPGWADGPKGDGVSDDTSAIQNILSPGSEAKWDGEGLPPVGRDFEIDVQTAILCHAGDAWRQCEILAHRGGKAICWVPTCNTVISTSNAEHFRSIRTKEQRQRDEIIDEAWAAIKQDYSEESTRQTHPQEYVLNAICQLYDSGLLRRPEGE